MLKKTPLFPFCECSSSQQRWYHLFDADWAIISQKSKVSADISPQRESIPVAALFLIQEPCERLFFANFHQRKRLFICLVLFRELWIGRQVSEKKTDVALLFLFILQETSFMRRRNAFLYGKKSLCSCLYTTQNELMGLFDKKVQELNSATFLQLISMIVFPLCLKNIEDQAKSWIEKLKLKVWLELLYSACTDCLMLE